MIIVFTFLLLFAWTTATRAQVPFYQGKTINVANPQVLKIRLYKLNDGMESE